MRARILVVISLCFVSTALYPWGNKTPPEFRSATVEELAMKSVPFAPGSSAVVLNWSQRRDDVDGFETEYRRIKILSEEGKNNANIEIPYVPLIANVDGIVARTTKPDGTVVPYTGKPFDKLLIRAGGLRVVAKTFSLPDVQVGSIIEYWYQLGFRGQMLHNTSFTIQTELPVLREDLWLRPYMRDYKSFFTYRGLPEGKRPVKNGDHFELVLENIPPFEKEPFAPPEGLLKPQVNFFYTAGETTPEAFWEKEGKEWADVIEGEIGDRGRIRQAAAEITTGATSPEAKLRKIYERVQQIRNRGFEHDTSEQEQNKLRENHSVEDVWRNGYGWPDEISRLFVALARGAGFEAGAIRSSQRDRSFFSKTLIAGDQLSADLAVVNVSGKEMLFDPGTPYTPFGVAAWQKSGVPALRLKRKTGGVWMETPDQPAAAAEIRRKAVVRIADDVVKASLSIQFDGQQALTRRLAAHDQDEATARKQLEDEIKAWFGEGTMLKMTDVHALRSPEEAIAVQADVELPSIGSFAGSRALIPMSVFSASSKNPFASADRKYPIYFNFAYQISDDVTLEIPPGYELESLPKPTRLDYSALVYENHYEKGDGTIHFTRKLTVSAPYIPTEHYQALRNFFSKVTAADQEQVVLRRASTKAAVQ